MKKYLFLMFISLSGMTARAQNTFAPVGAEWHYLGGDYHYSLFLGQFIGPTWQDRMVVEKDTVVDGLDCKKLTVTRMVKNTNATVAVLDTTVHHFSYNDEDTVFMFDAYTQSFRPLYVFNVNVGDTICVSTFAAPDTYYPDSNFCYVVDSVKMVLYEDEPLKTYYTNAIVNEDYEVSYNFGEGGYYSGLGWKHLGIYTERLGGGLAGVGLFPAASRKVVDGWPIKGIPSGGILCYTDSVISYKNTPLPCDSFVGKTAIIDRYTNTLGLQVYPNPATDKLTFTANAVFNEPTLVSIYDVSGRLVFSERLPKNTKVWTLSLPGLNKGTYLLKAKNNLGFLNQKLLIE